MKLTKELHKDIVNAKATIRGAENGLADITTRLLLNLEFEKAGAALPYSYTELHNEAEALRAEALAAPQALTDEVASFVPSMFPVLEGKGALVKAGTRINYNGTLYRATVDLWDTETNTPDKATTLWEKVTYKQGIRDIPQVITVTSAFTKGELGWWNGAIYESLLDNNVWTPAQYAAGWLLRGD